MINIVLNGKKEELERETPLSELLKKKNIRPEVVTVELNERILTRQEFDRTLLKDNDKLEFVYFMGGGGSTRLRSLTIIESNHPERMRSVATNESKDNSLFVYIIKCKDGSFYTGLTNDIKRRFKEHLSGEGSVYTKYSPPLKVVHVEKFNSLLGAQNRESQIKRWTHRKKEALVNNNLQLLKKL